MVTLPFCLLLCAPLQTLHPSTPPQSWTPRRQTPYKSKHQLVLRLKRQATCLERPVAGSVLRFMLSSSPKDWKWAEMSSCLASCTQWYESNTNLFFKELMKWKVLHFKSHLSIGQLTVRSIIFSITCGSPPTNSLRSSSSGRVTSDVSIDSAMLYDGSYKQSENREGWKVQQYVIYKRSLFLQKYMMSGYIQKHQYLRTSKGGRPAQCIITFLAKSF